MKRNGGDRVTVKYHNVYPWGGSDDWLSPLCLLAWMESTNLGTVPCGHYDVGVDVGSIVNDDPDDIYSNHDPVFLFGVIQRILDILRWVGYVNLKPWHWWPL